MDEGKELMIYGLALAFVICVIGIFLTVGIAKVSGNMSKKRGGIFYDFRKANIPNLIISFVVIACLFLMETIVICEYILGIEWVEASIGVQLFCLGCSFISVLILGFMMRLHDQVVKGG